MLQKKINKTLFKQKQNTTNEFYFSGLNKQKLNI